MLCLTWTTSSTRYVSALRIAETMMRQWFWLSGLTSFTHHPVSMSLSICLDSWISSWQWSRPKRSWTLNLARKHWSNWITSLTIWKMTPTVPCNLTQKSYPSLLSSSWSVMRVNTSPFFAPLIGSIISSTSSELTSLQYWRELKPYTNNSSSSKCSSNKMMA